MSRPNHPPSQDPLQGPPPTPPAHRILVLQQVPHEGPGTLSALLERHRVAMDVVPCFDPDESLPDALVGGGVDGYQGLVILGGPMSAVHPDPIRSAQLALIEDALKRGLPMLGICLGAQLIATVAGSRVYPGPAPEVGWGPVNLSPEGHADPMFARITTPLDAFHWHEDGFDLPLGATHLGSSATFPHQAFRLGAHTYGLQFHVEITAPMIRDWVDINAAAIAQWPGVEPDTLVADADARCASLAIAADALLTPWVQAVARPAR